MTLTKEKSCGALVYRVKERRIQLLIIKHRMGGHWSFPKGHVENQETEVETALREVKEETGLSIRLLEGFREQVSYFPRPGVSKDVVYFLGFASDSHTKMQEEEISALRWVDLSQCHKFLTYANDKLLLGRAKQHLKKHGCLDAAKKGLPPPPDAHPQQ
ncbi:NUDIX domain-containing protein [Ruminococcaceae bacterium OttesenSCG-928-L11]|nr:NUDIX domain-containing protein [Ruminococcaceae bacterium OttesenSCG-928-L11]